MPAQKKKRKKKKDDDNNNNNNNNSNNNNNFLKFFFKHNLKLPFQEVFGLGETFPSCNAKRDKLQSSGQGLGR